MVWNVLSLALNAEGIHVATCLHAKIRTLIQHRSIVSLDGTLAKYESVQRLTLEAKTMPLTIEE
jgi:hypothetical protein